MPLYQVSDMSCNHCVQTITKAVLAVDPQAQVQIDLGLKQVRIDTTQAPEPALRAAIEDVGFTPELQA